MVALLDTLEYLKRGGRISAAAGTLGEMLSIKPVITVADGEVAILGKARGSKNGRNLLRQQLESAGGIDFDMPVMVGYTGLSDKLLRKYLEDSRSVWDLGEMLSIKPVITVADGEVAILGKARGSKNGRNLLRQQLESAGGIDFDMPVMVGYTGLSDKLLRKYLEDSRSVWEGGIAEQDVPSVMVGATIGTHVGPGAIAVAYFKKA